MNNQEAKFILGAYRPDGRDSGDPMFAEALAHAERDPELRAWLAEQRKFDRTFASKLQAIIPPAGLREAILTGSRASAPQPKRHWWSTPSWMAAAAAIALLITAAVTLKPAATSPTAFDLAAFARSDLAGSHDDHVGHPPGLAEVQAQLASVGAPMSQNLKIDLHELRKKNCRIVRIGGREVFEICFKHDDTWYHVYVGKRADFAPGSLDPKALLSSEGQLASTAWADSTHVYALVTRAGAEVLRRVI
jgi:hypothetical protein